MDSHEKSGRLIFIITIIIIYLIKQQTLDKVQNEALQVTTGQSQSRRWRSLQQSSLSIKRGERLGPFYRQVSIYQTTPEKLAAIQPLYQRRRETWAFLEAGKFRYLQDHTRKACSNPVSPSN